MCGLLGVSWLAILARTQTENRRLHGLKTKEKTRLGYYRINLCLLCITLT